MYARPANIRRHTTNCWVKTGSNRFKLRLFKYSLVTFNADDEAETGDSGTPPDLAVAEAAKNKDKINDGKANGKNK